MGVCVVMCACGCVCGCVGVLVCVRVFAQGVGEGHLRLEVWRRWAGVNVVGFSSGDAGEEARTKILNDPIQPPGSSPPGFLI